MKNPELTDSAKLRLARAWMAEHGFSPHCFDSAGRGCFIGAIGSTNEEAVPSHLLELLRPHLPKIGLLGKRPTFCAWYLTEARMDTKKALAVFDAAIAKAEKKEHA